MFKRKLWMRLAAALLPTFPRAYSGHEFAQSTLSITETGGSSGILPRSRLGADASDDARIACSEALVSPSRLR